MRAVLGALSLLIALAVVGLLAKKQLSVVSAAPVELPADAAVALPQMSPGATPQQQSQQIQQQIRQTLESTLQQARPLPDEQ